MIIEQVNDQDGTARYLIPAALSNDKNPEWMSWKGRECPYIYIIGRVCCSEKLMNPSTLTKILHTVKKKFAGEKIAFFQGGFYIKTQTAHVLVEPVLSYRGFKAKLGILKSRAGTSKEEIKILIKENGAVFDKVFTEVCCACIEEANPSLPLKRKALSFEGMNEKDDTPFYDLSEVQRHYTDGKIFIDANTERSDITAQLLTWTEMSQGRRNSMVIF